MSDTRGPLLTEPAEPHDEGRRARRPRRQISVASAFNHPLADYGFLLGAVLILLVVGLVMVLSASTVYSFRNFDSSYYMFQRQLLFAAIGLIAMMFLSRQKPETFQRFSIVLLVMAFVLLLLVFMPGIGQTVNGQRNWIKLFGPFSMQPSEFAKWALLVWTATLIAKRRQLVDGWRSLLIPLAPVAGIMIVLVLAEGDLGTTLVMMPIVAAILLVAGAPLRLFGWMGAAIVTMVALMSIAAPYRLQRFATWLDPASDPTGAGWQVLHGQYALATGGWWGVGLGGSREKWGFLPEAQTDFILAVIGEELGLVGTLSILVLFVVIAIMITRIAFRTDDDFIRLATTGVGIWIVAQALINIGAVLGALPITGLPLPLVSYGGSSLMFTLMAIGMVLSFARAQPAAQEFLATRQAAKRAARPNRKSRRRRGAEAVDAVSETRAAPPEQGSKLAKYFGFATLKRKPKVVDLSDPVSDEEQPRRRSSRAARSPKSEEPASGRSSRSRRARNSDNEPKPKSSRRRSSEPSEPDDEPAPRRRRRVKP